MATSDINCKVEGGCSGKGESCRNDFDCGKNLRCKLFDHVCEDYEVWAECNVSEDCIHATKTGSACDLTRSTDICAYPTVPDGVNKEAVNVKGYKCTKSSYGCDFALACSGCSNHICTGCIDTFGLIANA